MDIVEEDLALEADEWLRAAVASATPDIPAIEVDRLVEAVRPAAEEAFESGLVQGLCREGARELLETTAVQEVRRLLVIPD